MKFITVITDYIRNNILTTRGDLLHRGATGLERLGAGIADQVLISNGPAADINWDYNNIFHDVNNVAFRTIIVDIGPWNMIANVNKIVAHGLTFANIISVTGYILNDTSNKMHMISLGRYTGGGDNDLYIAYTISAGIDIGRRTGGIFDHADFDDNVMNRGKMFIIYLI